MFVSNQGQGHILTLAHGHLHIKIKKKKKDYTIARDRVNEITFTQIKHNFSSLKADLLRVNIGPSALCSCGPIKETAEYFFFHCPSMVFIEIVY